MKLCRICLSRRGRLHAISKNGLDSAFQLLTGMPVDVNTRLPQWVCAECGLLLISYEKLRQKSHKSHKFLTALLTLNIVDIENIDWSLVNNETRLSLSEIFSTQYEPSIQESETLPLDVPLPILDVKTEDGNIYYDNNYINEQNDTVLKNEEHYSVIPLSPTKKTVEPLRERKVYIFYANNKTIDLEQKKNWKSLLEQEPIVNLVRLQLESSEKTLKCNEIKLELDNESKHSYVESFNDMNEETQINELEAFTIETDEGKNEFKTKISQITTPQRSNYKLDKSISRKRKITAKKNKATRRLQVDKSMFTISLAIEESRKEILKRKMSSNYVNAKFKCSDCFKGFLNEAAFERHRFVHSENSGPLECDVCKMHFSSRACLVSHIRNRHYNYTCKKCGYIAKNQSRATKHRSIHVEPKFKCKHCEMEFSNPTTYYSHLHNNHAWEFVCELCGLAFVSKVGVKRHKDLIHNRSDDANMSMEGPYCTTCDIKFATEEAYNKHLTLSSKHVTEKQLLKSRREKKHCEKKPTVCQLCDITLNSLMEYLKHFRTVHRGMQLIEPNNYVCEVCGQGFMYRYLYNEHVRNHDPEAQLKCGVCSRVCTSKYLLQAHMAVHDENRIRYPCEMCGKTVASLTTLREHLATAHSSETRFECAICARRFKVKSILKSHLRIHEENRSRHPCKLCEKDFATDKYLRRHMRVHTGVYKFTCEFCEKKFLDITAYRIHVDGVHFNKRRPRKMNDKEPKRKRRKRVTSASETDDDT